jgi:hypothetical protein
MPGSLDEHKSAHKKFRSLIKSGDMLHELSSGAACFLGKGRVLVGLGWSPAVVVDARLTAAA